MDETSPCGAQLGFAKRERVAIFTGKLKIA